MGSGFGVWGWWLIGDNFGMCYIWCLTGDGIARCANVLAAPVATSSMAWLCDYGDDFGTWPKEMNATSDEKKSHISKPQSTLPVWTSAGSTGFGARSLLSGC